MKSLADLNNYSQTTLTFDDLSSAEIQFTGTIENVDQKFDVGVSETLTYPIDITGITNGELALLSIEFDFSDVSGSYTLVQPTLPNTIELLQRSTDVYEYGNLQTASDWDIIKNLQVTFTEGISTCSFKNIFVNIKYYSEYNELETLSYVLEARTDVCVSFAADLISNSGISIIADILILKEFEVDPMTVTATLDSTAQIFKERVIFDRETPTNQLIEIDIFDDFDHQMPVGIEIEEIYEPELADVKLIIDLRTVFGPNNPPAEPIELQFNSIPQGVQITESPARFFTITGISSVEIWNQVSTPQIISSNNNLSFNTSYSASIEFTTINNSTESVSWDINVNTVVDTSPYFAGVNNKSINTTSNWSVTTPSQSNVGDLLILVGASPENALVSTGPSGWTQLRDTKFQRFPPLLDENEDRSNHIFYKFASSADANGNTYSYTLDTAVRGSVSCIAIKSENIPNINLSFFGDFITTGSESGKYHQVDPSEMTGGSSYNIYLTVVAGKVMSPFTSVEQPRNHALINLYEAQDSFNAISLHFSENATHKPLGGWSFSPTSFEDYSNLYWFASSIRI